MAKVNPDVLEAIVYAFNQYIDEVLATELASSTKRTYLTHALNFVRWLDDDFEPASRRPMPSRFSQADRDVFKEMLDRLNSRTNL